MLELPCFLLERIIALLDGAREYEGRVLDFVEPVDFFVTPAEEDFFVFRGAVVVLFWVFCLFWDPFARAREREARVRYLSLGGGES